MRFIRRLLFLLIFLCVGIACVLWVGAYTSLDRAMQHTAQTAALPVFTPKSADGLVQITAAGNTFRARVGGFDKLITDETRNLILLHGFPETSIMWERLIDAAADAGYRVVAFDQRGYSPGARPAAISDYAGDFLTNDVLAVADAVGFSAFHLVGHDWGAGVGWQLVLSHPERVTSWTSLSIPHLAAFGAAIQDDPDQQSKSAYMIFFRLPWLAEQVFAFNDFSLMRNGMYQEHPPAHRQEYLRVFAEPGAITGALNWYRASGEGIGGNASLSMQVNTPTLFIWGNADPAVGRVAVDGQRTFMQGPFTEIELDTGHWLMATEPTRVITAILEHLALVE